MVYSSEMELKEQVDLYLKAKQEYYAGGNPIMSDAEFDRLEEHIRSIAPNHPALAIVGSLYNKENTVKHVAPMLSTEKALDKEALFKWASKHSKKLVATTKLDGISMSLHYVDGILVDAATRGDGEFGTDVTAKVRSVVPNAIEYTGEVYIRGEVCISWKQFDELNYYLERKGEDTLANPRNGVSGIVVGEELVRADKLQFCTFIGYEVVRKDFSTFDDKLKWLESQGFAIPEYRVLEFTDSKADAENWDKRRSSIEYPIDGIVYRVSSEERFKELGHTSHHHRGMVAYKFPPDEAIVEVTEIKWSPGTQDISPVVHFNPTQLEGAVIRKASGHSVKNLIKLKAVPGSKVRLVRSGGVIPLLKPL